MTPRCFFLWHIRNQICMLELLASVSLPLPLAPLSEKVVKEQRNTRSGAMEAPQQESMKPWWKGAQQQTVCFQATSCMLVMSYDCLEIQSVTCKTWSILHLANRLNNKCNPRLHGGTVWDMPPKATPWFKDGIPWSTFQEGKPPMVYDPPQWVPGYLPHCLQQCNFWSYRSPCCAACPCNCAFGKKMGYYVVGCGCYVWYLTGSQRRAKELLYLSSIYVFKLISLLAIMVQQNTWIAHTAPQDVVDGMEQHVKCKHATHIAIPNKIDLFFSQYSWSQMQTYLLETPVRDTALYNLCICRRSLDFSDHRFACQMISRLKHLKHL